MKLLLQKFHPHQLTKTELRLLMDFLLSLPLVFWLLVQRPCPFTNVRWTEVFGIWRDNAADTQKCDMHILAVLVVNGKNQSSLSRFDHRQRYQGW